MTSRFSPLNPLARQVMPSAVTCRVMPRTPGTFRAVVPREQVYECEQIPGVPPVASVARTGMHTGVVTQLEKRTPSAAMRSRFGVLTQPPEQPNASQRCWSVMMKRMLGRDIGVGQAGL